MMLISTLVLAPIFEELLYRERLLLALKRVVGAPVAIVVTAACFALPHIQSWSLVGTFVVGVFLALVMLWTHSIALCISIHAGLNLAGAMCGIPPTRWYMDWTISAGISVALLVLAARWVRGGRLAEGRL